MRWYHFHSLCEEMWKWFRMEPLCCAGRTPRRRIFMSKWDGMLEEPFPQTLFDTHTPLWVLQSLIVTDFPALQCIKCCEVIHKYQFNPFSGPLGAPLGHHSYFISISSLLMRTRHFANQAITIALDFVCLSNFVVKPTRQHSNLLHDKYFGLRLIIPLYSSWRKGWRWGRRKYIKDSDIDWCTIWKWRKYIWFMRTFWKEEEIRIIKSKNILKPLHIQPIHRLHQYMDVPISHRLLPAHTKCLCVGGGEVALEGKSTWKEDTGERSGSWEIYCINVRHLQTFHKLLFILLTNPAECWEEGLQARTPWWNTFFNSSNRTICHSFRNLISHCHLPLPCINNNNEEDNPTVFFLICIRIKWISLCRKGSQHSISIPSFFFPPQHKRFFAHSVFSV